MTYTIRVGLSKSKRSQKARGLIFFSMENRNFLVLDGGLGSALIRAGFDIDVSNSTLFLFY